MPIYEFLCKSCNKSFDLYLKMKDPKDNIPCPTCQSSMNVEKKLTSPNIIIDNKQPKTIGDQIHKNTEDKVKKGELNKSALEYESIKRENKKKKEKMNKILKNPEKYITTGEV